MGPFTAAMNKIKDLRDELKDNVGRSDWSWGGLNGILGERGAMAVKVEITLLIVLIMISLFVFCIIPILRFWGFQTDSRSSWTAADPAKPGPRANAGKDSGCHQTVQKNSFPI